MSDAPLIPGAVYGLRAWRWRMDDAGERLTAFARGTPWPEHGTWLTASCDADPSHVAPVAGCACGVHAWHPRRASARRVLSGRRDIPGVVEATGAIEVHEEGFRAARARPRALFLTPGANPARLRRLAERHGAELVPVAGPAELLRWCAERDMGLDEKVVAGLLGAEELARRARERRARRRRDVLRVGVAVAVAIALPAAGMHLATDAPGPHDLYGRTGPVHVR